MVYHSCYNVRILGREKGMSEFVMYVYEEGFIRVVTASVYREGEMNGLSEYIECPFIIRGK